MADCCLLELEDPDWLDPQHPMYDFMLEQGGRRGRGRARPATARVEPPPGCDEMVLDFAIQADVLASGFADPVSRFEGDWEAEFVGGSGGGRQYQKRRPGGRLPPAGEVGFDSTCGVAPWDAVGTRFIARSVVVFVRYAGTVYLPGYMDAPAIERRSWRSA